MKEKTCEYDAELEKKWNKKQLKEEWFEKYRVRAPLLFTDKDYEIAENQGPYHFSEWFMAVKYIEKGYHVLCENYMVKPEKRRVLEGIIKDTNKLDLIYPGSGPQPPDLFVYNDEKEYFFVEVKKGRDRLGPEQKLHFEKIEKEISCDVILVKLKKKV